MNSIMNLRVPESVENLLTSWGTHHYARRTPCCLGFVLFASYSHVFAHCNACISLMDFLNSQSFENVCVWVFACLLFNAKIPRAVSQPSKQFLFISKPKFHLLSKQHKNLILVVREGSAQGVRSWLTGGWLYMDRPKRRLVSRWYGESREAI
jgi:hypothetical protein